MIPPLTRRGKPVVLLDAYSASTRRPREALDLQPCIPDRTRSRVWEVSVLEALHARLYSGGVKEALPSTPFVPMCSRRCGPIPPWSWRRPQAPARRRAFLPHCSSGRGEIVVLEPAASPARTARGASRRSSPTDLVGWQSASSDWAPADAPLVCDRGNPGRPGHRSGDPRVGRSCWIEFQRHLPAIALALASASRRASSWSSMSATLDAATWRH